MRVFSPIHYKSGFTLIELLIAIFIFGIVISSVYGAYRATFYVVHGSEYQLEIANRARVVVERLSSDLGSIVTGPGAAFNGEPHKYADSIGDSLSFVSLAHLVLRKDDTYAGPTLIEYKSELDMDTGLLNLYRTEKVILPGVEATDDEGEADEQKHLICQGLREFKFTYRDQDGNETDEWVIDDTQTAAKNVKPSAKETKSTTEETKSSARDTKATGKDGATAAEQFPVLVTIELKFAKSVDSETSTVFKTAVALPQPAKRQG